MNERETDAIHFRLESLATVVDVQLRRSGPRWVVTADVAGRQIVAIGMSPREAMRVCFEPLGQTRATALMADLGLLEPSVALLRMDAATVA
jgi:hypothetical protein